MATKKFIIEVEEGRTGCSECPLAKIADCYLYQEVLQICDNYDLTTIKIKELEEEKCEKE